MALFQISLRFSWDIPAIARRKWSNVFFSDQPTAQEAATLGAQLWANGLRQGARNRVFLYEVYATDLVQGTTNYYIEPIPDVTQRGSLTPPTGQEAYDPIVCASITLQVPNSRPSRKFWRPGLWESDVVQGQALAGTLVGQINTAWETMLDLYASELRDPDGQPYGGLFQQRYTRRRFGRESTENLPASPSFE